MSGSSVDKPYRKRSRSTTDSPKGVKKLLKRVNMDEGKVGDMTCGQISSTLSKLLDEKKAAMLI